MNDHKREGKQDKSEPRRRGVLRLVGGGRRLWIILIFVLIALIAVWLKVVWGGKESTSNLVTFVAKRGPLTISILESGTIEAREQITLRNEVEGRTSIVSLVPEGTRVKAGDLLVELDASTLKDSIIDQEIQVQRAEAAYINAQETLAVVQNQTVSDVNVAELTLEFAIQDLDQYKAGKYPNEKTAAENEITLAREELSRAEETMKWSEKLYNQNYISQTELQGDQLAVTRTRNKLVLANNEFELLQNFTYHRNIAQLESDVRQSEMALERAKRKARADVIQAEAELKAKELEYKRQQDKLKKMEDQLSKTKIYAPQEGMVIYATTSGRRSPFDRREPMDIGVEVTERQDLIQLPTAAWMKAQVDIHETSLEKVSVGLPVVITIDALAGKKFLGHVASIAPLPDARSMWMNPDLKIYPTDINLEDTDSALRTGMSCKAEIIVSQYEDAVYVPVQAVLRVGSEHVVYIVKDGAIEERNVEIGLDNNRMVRIVSGLDGGEVVLLTPPLKAAAIEPGSKTAATESPNDLGVSDTIMQRVNQKLEETNGTGQGTPGQGPSGPEGFESPSSDQMEQMRRRFENMSPEERQKEIERMRQRFQNMAPEERQRMQERFQGAGTEQEGGTRQGGGPRQRGGARSQGSERNQ